MPSLPPYGTASFISVRPWANAVWSRSFFDIFVQIPIIAEYIKTSIAEAKQADKDPEGLYVIEKDSEVMNAWNKVMSYEDDLSDVCNYPVFSNQVLACVRKTGQVSCKDNDDECLEQIVVGMMWPEAPLAWTK